MSLGRDASALTGIEAQLTREWRHAAGAPPGTSVSAPDIALPSAKILARIGADLPAFAKQNELLLQDVTYLPMPAATDAAGKQVQISVRMKGGYLQVKRLTQQLLAAYESLSLESMSLRRNRATDTVLDVEMQLSLFYRAGQ